MFGMLTQIEISQFLSCVIINNCIGHFGQMVVLCHWLQVSCNILLETVGYQLQSIIHFIVYINYPLLMLCIVHWCWCVLYRICLLGKVCYCGLVPIALILEFVTFYYVHLYNVFNIVLLWNHWDPMLNHPCWLHCRRHPWWWYCNLPPWMYKHRNFSRNHYCVGFIWFLWLYVVTQCC